MSNFFSFICILWQACAATAVVSTAHLQQSALPAQNVLNQPSVPVQLLAYIDSKGYYVKARDLATNLDM